MRELKLGIFPGYEIKQKKGLAGEGGWPIENCRIFHTAKQEAISSLPFLSYGVVARNPFGPCGTFPAKKEIGKTINFEF